MHAPFAKRPYDSSTTFLRARPVSPCLHERCTARYGSKVFRYPTRALSSVCEQELLGISRQILQENAACPRINRIRVNKDKQSRSSSSGEIEEGGIGSLPAWRTVPSRRVSSSSERSVTEMISFREEYISSSVNSCRKRQLAREIFSICRIRGRQRTHPRATAKK
jgi:hypothetical protein